MTQSSTKRDKSPSGGGRARLKEKEKKTTLSLFAHFAVSTSSVSMVISREGRRQKTFAFYLVFKVVCNQKRKKDV